ncbi:glutamate--tRNA ligase [Candidatus Gracilibacteria bacterium]|nr:glutamate--tRNA ligase [Candidatus Gracilibacteria bacterium]MCF7856757.1 glutamate--tRNA ligase [Candidatus Gracilibacteria bacterium]MCF7897037.1 glutamate--tRNA ligase [Candidatus Gracilibacteria bacterium]
MIKVRFPPSPTGPMHIGTARTLLVNFLFARKNGGKIVFRSEDTDRERSTPEFEKELRDGLDWLGLDFDEGPFRQSERDEIYEKHFEELKKSDAIYPCFCSTEELATERELQNAQKLPPRYSGKCRDLSAEEIAEFEKAGRKPVWRFRVPAGEIKFDDLVRGEISEKGENIGDFVIRKSDGQFLYHFTVVVDDAEMAISHVIRGEDHISNTSKHILLFEALGRPVPRFGHLPLLLNKDRSKMSKRDESGKPATIERLKNDGYLSEAVVNFLALLGWNPGGGSEQEFFSRDDLIAKFDFNGVAKAGAVFDLERLNFFNAHYLRELSNEELAEKVKPFLDFEIDDEDVLKKAVKLAAERMKFFGEAREFLHYFFGEIDPPVELFENPKMKVDRTTAAEALTESLPVLKAVENWTTEEIQKSLLELVTKLEWKNGQLLWPLRVALSGEKFSPGVWEMAEVLGREKSLQRIRKELDKLKK